MDNFRETHNNTNSLNNSSDKLSPKMPTTSFEDTKQLDQNLSPPSNQLSTTDYLSPNSQQHHSPPPLPSFSTNAKQEHTISSIVTSPSISNAPHSISHDESHGPNNIHNYHSNNNNHDDSNAETSKSPSPSTSVTDSNQNSQLYSTPVSTSTTTNVIQNNQTSSLSSPSDMELKDSVNKRKKNSRRKHRNSHLGCGTCKKRRIKCDETLPCCLNCLKGKLHCAYLNLDNNARNALRLAQYNQNLRQEKVEVGGDKISNPMSMNSQGANPNPISLIQIQGQPNQMLSGFPPQSSIPPPNSSYQQIAPQQGPPPPMVYQTQYGLVVPVVTSTGVVYAQASPIAPPPPSQQQQQSQQSQQQPTPAYQGQPQQIPAIIQPHMAPQQQIQVTSTQAPVNVSVTSNVPAPGNVSAPLQQQSQTQKQQQSSVLPPSNIVSASVSQQAVPLKTQGSSMIQQASLTPITSSAANTATIASQNILLSKDSKLNILPLPTTNVKIVDSQSRQPSINQNSSYTDLKSFNVNKSPSNLSSPDNTPVLPNISQLKNSGSVSNFGQLSIKDENAIKLPSINNLKSEKSEEEKVSISKLIS